MLLRKWVYVMNWISWSVLPELYHSAKWGWWFHSKDQVAAIFIMNVTQSLKNWQHWLNRCQRLSWRKILTADKLTLLLLMGRGEMVMIRFIKSISVISSGLQNDLQICSLLFPLTQLVEKGNLFILFVVLCYFIWNIHSILWI